MSLETTDENSNIICKILKEEFIRKNSVLKKPWKKDF